MRLTNSIRSAFVQSVMNDVPSVDYTELMQKEANRIGRAMMPPEIAAVYDKYPDWFEPEWAKIGQWCGYGPFPHKRAAFRAEDIQAMDRLGQLKAEQNQAHGRLRNQLEQAAASATTTKALAEMFPEFAKYLPAEETKTRNLPAIANVVADFMKAGWPKNQTV